MPKNIFEVQAGSGKNKQITYPRKVACSSKQLFFSYQIVFFKNDDWRIYSVKSWISIYLINNGPVGGTVPYMDAHVFKMTLFHGCELHVY